MAKFDCWKLVDALAGKTRRLLLYGPPGTGKTHAATVANLDDSQRRDVQSVIVTEDTPAAELRGHFIPAGTGHFAWHDGPAITAWRKGNRLVIDEIDHACGDVHSFLLKLLDDPTIARLTLPSGETIEPSSGFSCIATMNGDLDDLPPALRDRFPASVEIDRPHPLAVASLPEDLRELAQASAMVPDEYRRVSVRVWKEFATLRESIGVAMAAQACFGNRADDLRDAIQIAR